ncbi:MFS transporter [Thermodesulfobacteriota bacterium]
MPHRPKDVQNDMPVSGLALEIGVATICRLALNTARRFAYPFAPVLSRGLGVSLTSITSIIAVNQATAVIGIFFGPLADRLGYRLMMFVGLGMLVVGMFSAGCLPFYGVILTALFLAGLGKSLFDPALQAYIGERVPFERRGLVIGVLEFSWAGSTLLGIPLIALLIDRLGWRSPFFALGGVGLLGIVALKMVQSKDITKPAARRTGLGLSSAWGQLLKKRSALGAIGFAFFVSMANDNLFVIYGAWLENAFDLSIVAIGVGTSVIGIAELSGEGLTAAMSDRLGLKRSVILGLVLCMMSYGMLPLLGKALPTALGGLFLIFLTYEFAIVTALSLCTELLPDYRATMMSSFLAAAGAGRVIGALIGGRIWLAGGIFTTGMVSAAISGLGLASLIWGLRGWSRH